jgi:16S rRNA (cytosine967-C5)-methyltransferase
LDVTASGAYSTLALDEHLRTSRIDPQDKRLATSIFYTTLENRLKLQYVLKQFVERMPDREIGCVLHIAAAQLLLMDKMPDYAVVDAAAEQARALNREPYVALVNGALRSLIRARDAGEIRWPDRSDPLNYLSVMHSLPEPLAARLIRDYGLEEAERIIAYRPEVRTETVRPNLNQMDAAAFEEFARRKGWNLEKATADNAWHITRPGDLTGDPDYKAGLYSVQGEGSMLAAYALEPKRAGNYLDACAAPGGKSALIAEMMQLTGRVQSWDVHEHRVELIQNTKKRLGLDSLRPAHRDAAVHREDLDATFDGVLIDAPCSGLGVMHDKPDIKYRVTEADLDSLTELQKRILDACAPYVAVGGLLVYATCTILKDENERQVRSFLINHPEFEPEMSRAYLPESLKPLTVDGMVQLQAYQWNAEGFFIARMRRVRP